MKAKVAGRPPERRVTAALFEAAIAELSEKGFEKATIAAIASRAHTSKQAVYRRFNSKTVLMIAALEEALSATIPSTPRRASVAEDLRQCLMGTVKAFQNTQLGNALRAAIAQPHTSELAKVFRKAEETRRLAMRQVLIATSFESDMELRIDLLHGLIIYRLLSHGSEITDDDIERAIFLVLGLVAPRETSGYEGYPGV